MGLRGLQRTIAPLSALRAITSEMHPLRFVQPLYLEAKRSRSTKVAPLCWRHAARDPEHPRDRGETATSDRGKKNVLSRASTRSLIGIRIGFVLARGLGFRY